MKKMPMKRVLAPYRYVYTNKLYREHGAIHGTRCNPVRREDGKCCVSTRHALVTFENGEQAIVIRRCLRLVEKQ